jgi:hypothetical protein
MACVAIGAPVNQGTSEREEKRGAFAKLRLGPDPPAMAGNDALNDRESDAGPCILVAIMESLKGCE